jgi:predicted enzyme related to lactoylglutathione lyase
MSDLNSKHNRAVWIDVPVADLDRATAFYAAVLGVGVTKQQYGEFQFSVIDHQDGNGGCLIPNPGQITSAGGLLVYFNVDGRLPAAVAQVQKLGGQVLEGPHSIGPHGFRAIVLDSEGNRVALHSRTEA